MTDFAAKKRAALELTEKEIKEKPLSSNAKAAAELLAGRKGAALDVGCGEGKFTRSLTDIYSKVGGIDVKQKVIDRAKAAASAEGKDVDFMVASAEDMPFADASFDTVVISNSLHHFPDPRKGLAEAARVLAPGGILYVMEPVASGHYHEATKVVNDETIVRREAYDAMLAMLDKGFTETKEMMYRQRRVFDTFEEWRDDQIDRDEKRKAKFDADPDGVRERFVSLADKDGGKLGFDQVFRVNVLKKAG
ncbi:MAG: class I SAM-dependent methyltransferase [Beijerinckiaceae bacterium]